MPQELQTIRNNIYELSKHTRYPKLSSPNTTNRCTEELIPTPLFPIIACGQGNFDIANGKLAPVATVSLAALDCELCAASDTIPFSYTRPQRSFYLADIVRLVADRCKSVPSDSPIPQVYPSPSPSPDSVGSLSDPDSLGTSASPAFKHGGWLLRPNPSLGSRHHQGSVSLRTSSSPDTSNSLAHSNISSHCRLGAKASLNVDVRLRGELHSRTGRSMTWPAGNGSIIFAKVSQTRLTVPHGSKIGQIHSTALLVSNPGGRRRVFRARQSLKEEMKEGTFWVQPKKAKGAWGWLPWRRRHRRDVERARSNLGIVEVSISNRARLVSCEQHNGTMCLVGR